MISLMEVMNTFQIVQVFLCSIRDISSRPASNKSRLIQWIVDTSQDHSPAWLTIFLSAKNGKCPVSNELLIPNSVQDAPVAVDLEGEIGAGDGGRPVAVVVDLGHPELVDVVESIEVPWGEKFQDIIWFEIPI